MGREHLEREACAGPSRGSRFIGRETELRQKLQHQDKKGPVGKLSGWADCQMCSKAKCRSHEREMLFL